MEYLIVLSMFAVCIITCVLVVLNASGIILLVSCIVLIALAITLDIIQNKEDDQED